jgi:hypothetical protein
MFALNALPSRSESLGSPPALRRDGGPLHFEGAIVQATSPFEDLLAERRTTTREQSLLEVGLNNAAAPKLPPARQRRHVDSLRLEDALASTLLALCSPA